MRQELIVVIAIGAKATVHSTAFAFDNVKEIVLTTEVLPALLRLPRLLNHALSISSEPKFDLPSVCRIHQFSRHREVPSLNAKQHRLRDPVKIDHVLVASSGA